MADKKFTKEQIAKTIKSFDGDSKAKYIAAKDTLRSLAQLFVGGNIVYKDTMINVELLKACKDILEIETTLSNAAKDILQRVIIRAEENKK